MSAPRRKTYHGTQRRLVIAFDIGTTFSGVSYALLIPSEPPLIQGVTRFPGQQMVGGDSKIPSVVCYDSNFGIRSGSFKISGTHIVDFFEPAVQGIIRTIEEQAQRSALPINTIFMVGGFATSHYLFLKLSEHFMTKNIKILRPDAYLNKAVSEGAASFSIDHAVTSRVARYTYGIKYRCDFDADKPDHIERRHTCIEELDGTLLVRNAFSPILIKDTEVSEEKEFRESFSDVYTKSGLRELTVRSIPIKCYRNRWGDVPAWTDIEPDLFPDVCLITADFSQVKKSIGSQTNLETGGKYYRLNFDVILLFGLTELKAQISWIENGQEKRGPASIVYDVTPIAKF
ncbi:hypothetical protein APHAL10511_003529 [Amanita phalloides]|nr:hypothetical protein APHAL10511_003529 [Amanita phalloides]